MMATNKFLVCELAHLIFFEEKLKGLGWNGKKSLHRNYCVLISQHHILLSSNLIGLDGNDV